MQSTRATRLISALALSALALSASAQHDHGNHAPATHATPIAGDIRSLDVYAHRGALHLLLAAYDPQTERNELLYQRSSDHGATWLPPVRIDAGQLAPHARGRGADFHLAVHGQSLVAVWMTHGSGFGQRGPLVAARSEDLGATWRPIPTPSDDGGDGDHAFIDVAATPDGTFHTVWLDTRSGAGKGLVTAAISGQSKTWQTNAVIDTQTCECCWNTLQSDAAGTLYALYRDLNPRDMAIARSTDNGKSWARLSTVGPFDWQFDGCPHVGGGLAIENAGPAARLHTLVWTGKSGVAGLYYQRASAPEFRWSRSLRIGGDRAKHADIAIDASHRLLAIWTEQDPQEAALLYSLSDDSGQTWTPPVHLPSHQPSHPRVVAIGETFHLFWTETDDRKSVWRHMALLPTR